MIGVYAWSGQYSSYIHAENKLRLHYAYYNSKNMMGPLDEDNIMDSVGTFCISKDHHKGQLLINYY